MNAGHTSVGVSHRRGNGFVADHETLHVLADPKSPSRDSCGHLGSAFLGALYVDPTSSTMHPQLARVTQTILTKTADQAVFPCYNTKAVKGYDRRSGWGEPGKSSRGGSNQ